MSTNFGWGGGEAEGRFDTLQEQEAYGGNGEASYYEQEGYGQLENGYGETENTYAEGEIGQDAEGVFDEAEEMELAGDLLSLGSETELDQAVGRLMDRAARTVGGSMSRDVGMALGSAIKAAVHEAMSAAGSPGGAGELFGIETEGLSGEDQDFELMRRAVRFGGAATGRAARAPRGINPRAIVRSALISAARRWAPGLLRRWGRGYPRPRGPRRRWPHWRGIRRRWGVPPPPYGYPPYAQYPPPYPGAPEAQPAQQPSMGFGGGGAPSGVGGATDPSAAATTQGMQDSAAGPDSTPIGGDGGTPQSGRWSRQGTQLIIHL